MIYKSFIPSRVPMTQDWESVKGDLKDLSLQTASAMRLPTALCCSNKNKESKNDDKRVEFFLKSHK